MSAILGLLGSYKALWEPLAFAALLAGVAFGVHEFIAHEQDLGYQRAVAEYQAKLVQAQAAADAQTRALQQQLQEAQHAAAQRDQEIRSLAAASSAASGGLRDALAHIRSGLPGDSAAAAAHAADTLATLLDECQGSYRDLAEKADRHVGDLQTLKAAWPRSRP